MTLAGPPGKAKKKKKKKKSSTLHLKSKSTAVAVAAAAAAAGGSFWVSFLTPDVLAATLEKQRETSFVVYGDDDDGLSRKAVNEQIHIYLSLGGSWLILGQNI